MMGMLAESLRSIIEGPLGEHGVTIGKVRERVATIRQNERRTVFGVSIFRDGDDRYFIGEESEPASKKGAAEAVKGALQQQGRLLDDDGHVLDEKLSSAALRAMQDQEKAAQEHEAKIGAAFKKLGKRYAEALSKMSGKEWKVANASADIFSLDSDDKPKRAVDIYWEADPGTNTATIYIEGPKGKREVYKKQRLADIPKKNYVAWLQGVLKEEMRAILGMAMMEMAEPEVIFEHAVIIEEVKGVLAEFEVYKKRGFGHAPNKGRKTPSVVGSLTKVNALFKRLLLTLKRGGDFDNVIWLLRKESVPESDINYAIRRLRMPMAYAEEVDLDGDALDEGEWDEAEEADLFPFESELTLDRIEELTGEGGHWEGGSEGYQAWFNRTKGYDLKTMRKMAIKQGYADLSGASKHSDYQGVGEIIGYMLRKGRPVFVLDDQITLRQKSNIDSFTLGLHIGLGEGPALEPKDKTKWKMKQISSAKTRRKGWRVWVTKVGARELPSKVVQPKGFGKKSVGSERRAVNRLAAEPDHDFTKTKIVPKRRVRAAS